MTVGAKPIHPAHMRLGREVEMSLANGEKRRVRFALVALSAILASHNESTFALTPGYPQLPDGRSVNDRNYLADRNAQSQVRRMAQQLEAGRLITTSRTPSGTPIISVDGMAVSGNNRLMSLKLAQREFPEQFAAYHRLLLEELPSFGLTAPDFIDEGTWRWKSATGGFPESVSSPVLVRIDYDFPAYAPAELAKYNQDTKKGERPVDRALKLSEQLRASPAAMRVLATEIGNFDTFSEFHASSPAVRQVREALLSAGVVLPQEASTYFADNGAFTEAGRTLLERAAAGLALTPAALVALEAEGLGTWRGTIGTSLPVLLANGKLPAEWTLTPALSEAIELQQQIQSSAGHSGSATSADAFSAFVRTPQLEGRTWSRRAMVLCRLLTKGRRAFKAALEAYNHSAEEAASGLAMFAPVTPAEAFTHVERQLTDEERRVIDLVTQATAPASLPVSPAPLGAAIAHGTIPAESEPVNLLLDGNWFKAYPEKLLGTPKQVSTRFGGNATVLTGTLADAMAKIQAPVTRPVAAPAVPLTAASPRALLLDPDMRAAAVATVRKTEQAIGQRAVAGKPLPGPAVQQEVHSFDSALQELNRASALTDAHYQCFAFHKQQEGDPIGGEFGQRFNVPPPEDRLQRWVEMGIAAYDGQRYQYAALFYSGNCYERLEEMARRREAIVATVGEAQYERQRAELLRRRPTPLTVTDPVVENRLILKPISAFAKQLFKIRSLVDGEPFTYTTKQKYGPDKIVEYEATLYGAFYAWVERVPATSFKNGATSFEVRTYYLNHASLPNPNRDPKVEAQNSRIRQRARAAGEELFREFLATQLTAEDQRRLEEQWNASYNAWIAPDLRLVPVAFRWAKTDAKGLPLPVKWEKREAVSFLLTEGAGCLAYDVGVGKTFSATFAIEQALEFEYCARPLIVTPNQVYKQFIAEIKGLLPHRQVNGFYNMGSEMAATIAATLDADGMVPAGSITVITKEGMELLGLLPATLARLKGEFYAILNQGNESQRESAALELRLSTMLGKGQRGSEYALEELGFDYLCVDEAHSLKKSFTRVKGAVTETGSRDRTDYELSSGEPSALALRGFCLAHYVMDTNQGRNVLLLTATPFTNSPLEVYSMLALVAYRKLQAAGQHRLVDFFDTYVAVSNELVVTPSMKIAYKQIVLGFNNLHSLQALVRRYILYKTGEDVGVERPNKLVLPLTLSRDDAGNVTALPADEVVLTRLPMTALQKRLMTEVIAYVEGQVALSELCTSTAGETLPGEESTATINPKAEELALTGEEKKGVRILRGLNFARNIALSPYLYTCSQLGNPSARQYVESSPKLTYVMQCIARVRDHHQANGEPVSGQIIYMDRGVELFPLLREYLIHVVGFQEHEVAMIYSGLSADQKERIKQGFLGQKVDARTGQVTELPEEKRIKVVIGSSTIKEGLNLQRHGTVLYNCFLDWNPTDIKQLEGRIWRFGNKYANVLIVNPMLEDSADAFIFQKLQEKTSRINEIWAEAGKVNALNLEEFDPGELKMALLTDPRKAAEAQVAELKAKAEGHAQQLAARLDEIATFQETLPKARALEAEYRAFVFGLLTPEQQAEARAAWAERSFDSIRRRHLDLLASDKYKWNQQRAEFGQLAQLREARRIVAAGQVSILQAFQIDESGLEDLLVKLTAEQVKAYERVFQDFSEDAIQKLADRIAAQRAADDAASKPVEARVEEFARLLPKLRLLAPGEKLPPPRPRRAPKYATCPPRQADGRPAIDEEALEALRRCLFELPSTKSLHVDEHGRYSPERQALHQRIIDEFGNRPCVIGRPVAILTGGLPGSGKSHLIKNSPFAWMNDEEHVIHVDADAVRARLPEYEGWNADSTHQETKDLVSGILDRIGIPCTSDLVYDGTMNKIKSYLPLIEKLRGYGYEIYVLFVRVPFEVSRERVLDRYQRTGRYVPIEIIQDAYHAGDEALLQMKNLVDGYVVYDGVSGRELERGGKQIPEKREYVTEKPSSVTPSPAPAVMGGLVLSEEKARQLERQAEAFRRHHLQLHELALLSWAEFQQRPPKRIEDPALSAAYAFRLAGTHYERVGIAGKARIQKVALETIYTNVQDVALRAGVILPADVLLNGGTATGFAKDLRSFDVWLLQYPQLQHAPGIDQVRRRLAGETPPPAAPKPTRQGTALRAASYYHVTEKEGALATRLIYNHGLQEFLGVEKHCRVLLTHGADQTQLRFQRTGEELTITKLHQNVTIQAITFGIDAERRLHGAGGVGGGGKPLTESYQLVRVLEGWLKLFGTPGPLIKVRREVLQRTTLELPPAAAAPIEPVPPGAPVLLAPGAYQPAGGSEHLAAQLLYALGLQHYLVDPGIRRARAIVGADDQNQLWVWVKPRLISLIRHRGPKREQVGRVDFTLNDQHKLFLSSAETQRSKRLSDGDGIMGLVAGMLADFGATPPGEIRRYVDEKSKPTRPAPGTGFDFNAAQAEAEARARRIRILQLKRQRARVPATV